MIVHLHYSPWFGVAALAALGALWLVISIGHGRSVMRGAAEEARRQDTEAQTASCGNGSSA